MMKSNSATWLLTLAMLGSSAVYAYTPPIGIPEPSFGIDETAPAQPAAWPTSEAAGFYYVDKSHPSATDTGNPYGYPNKPRLTIPNTTFGAGTYVELHGGTYSSNMSLNFNCTQAAPCWVRGANSTTMPTISASISINSKYLIVENLDFNGGVGGAINVTGTSQYVAIRHSKIRNRAHPTGATAGIGAIPGPGQKVSDLVIYKNEFSDLGDWLRLDDLDFHAVNPNLWNRDSTADLSNIWVLENTCFHISGNCVQVNAGNWTDSWKYLHHVYIGRNVSHSGRQAGFWSKQARDVIISQNVVYDNRAHGPQPGDGIGFQYGPDNLWIIFNEIYDCNYGIRQSDTGTSASGHKAYILGNLIYNIHPEDVTSYKPSDGWRQGVGITLWHGNMQRYIVDNTIYNVHGGINTIYDGPVALSGNIISNIHDADYHVSISHSARSGVASIDGGLFYDPELASARVNWNWADYTSLSAFVSGTGNTQCGICAVGNPAFVDPATGKYDLQKNSAAINKGKLHSAYDTFFALYGIDIKKDFEGRSRVLGLKPDFGAFEVGVAPAAPSNFAVK
ncbi:MAG: hypothetical protein AB1810_14095 [Pseudomonadota bacterium]